METRASRVVEVAGSPSQAAPSSKLETSNARVRVEVEAGRSRKETTKKAQVLRARVVLVG